MMKRKPINTKLHGIIDYAFAFVLLLPWITDFNQASRDTIMLSSVGILVVFTSVLTDYEFGLIKLIPMRVHLVLDILISIFLVATPWIFPVYNYLYYWPLLLGCFGLLTVLLSSA